MSTPAIRHKPPNDDAASSDIASRRKISFTLSLWLVFGMIVVSVVTYLAAHFWLKPLLLDIASVAGIHGLVAENPTSSPGRGLGLKAVQSGGSALEITWDGTSPLIQASQSAKFLAISGSGSRQVELDRNQLRSGRIFYIPAVPDITFRLEVTDSRLHSIAESIRVLRDCSSGSCVPDPHRSVGSSDPSETRKKK